MTTDDLTYARTSVEYPEASLPLVVGQLTIDGVDVDVVRYARMTDVPDKVDGPAPTFGHSDAVTVIVRDARIRALGMDFYVNAGRFHQAGDKAGSWSVARVVEGRDQLGQAPDVKTALTRARHTLTMRAVYRQYGPVAEANIGTLTTGQFVALDAVAEIKPGDLVAITSHKQYRIGVAFKVTKAGTVKALVATPSGGHAQGATGKYDVSARLYRAAEPAGDVDQDDAVAAFAPVAGEAELPTVPVWIDEATDGAAGAEYAEALARLERAVADAGGPITDPALQERLGDELVRQLRDAKTAGRLPTPDAAPIIARYSRQSFTLAIGPSDVTYDALAWHSSGGPDDRDATLGRLGWRRVGEWSPLVYGRSMARVEPLEGDTYEAALARLQVTAWSVGLPVTEPDADRDQIVGRLVRHATNQVVAGNLRPGAGMVWAVIVPGPGSTGGAVVDGSHLAIEGVEYDVPDRVEHGGVLAPARLAHALRAAGYEPAHPDGYYASLSQDGRILVRSRPAEPVDLVGDQDSLAAAIAGDPGLQILVRDTPAAAKVPGPRADEPAQWVRHVAPTSAGRVADGRDLLRLVEDYGRAREVAGDTRRGLEDTAQARTVARELLGEIRGKLCGLLGVDLVAGADHVTRIVGPDLAGHWGWECDAGDADASGYEGAAEVLEAAGGHAPLAADSVRPYDVDDNGDELVEHLDRGDNEHGVPLSTLTGVLGFEAYDLPTWTLNGYGTMRADYDDLGRAKAWAADLLEVGLEYEQSGERPVRWVHHVARLGGEWWTPVYGR